MLPVLFVHGHLGTHQQMRSMASETARELRRRAAAGSGVSYWATWQAADFGGEMSALSGGVLVGSGGARGRLRCSGRHT